MLTLRLAERNPDEGWLPASTFLTPGDSPSQSDPVSRVSWASEPKSHSDLGAPQSLGFYHEVHSLGFLLLGNTLTRLSQQDSVVVVHFVPQPEECFPSPLLGLTPFPLPILSPPLLDTLCPLPSCTSNWDLVPMAVSRIPVKFCWYRVVAGWTISSLSRSMR